MSGPYKEVRALTRGLDVLVAVNRGLREVSEIAAAVGLSRPTVYRLLDTLVHGGYLVRSDSDGTYRPTVGVRSLSEGFRDEAWITQLAVPALRGLLDEVQWPSDIATFDGGAMVARESTHRFSTLSFHRPIARRRMVMVSALGVVYVAHLPEREQKKVLAALRRSDEAHDRWWRKGVEVRAALARARAAGFAFVEGEVERGIMAVAVPVLFRARPIAAINVIVTRTAMTRAELELRFVAPLRRAAAHIERALAAGAVDPPRRAPT